MTSPTYFTVVGDFKSIVADTVGDTDADPDSVSLLATVTFTPRINDGDLILATNASPRPTAFVAAPISGTVGSDGILKLRDAGSSGFPGLSYTPVRLLADTPLLELDGDLFYDVTFSNVSYNGRFITLNGFTFQAPTSDVTLNLVTVARAPGQPATAITKIAPTGVRFTGGNMVFSFSGVDIPEPLPLSSITGPQAPQGPQGIQGQAGVSLDINGTVANWSLLPANEPDGSAYINAADGKLYYRFDGQWPADGDGVPFVGPAGPTGAQGIQGPSGTPGASGVPGAVGATGPVGATGASGASGGTGGTGLAGQSVQLKGSVAAYSLLPGSATNGDGYILLTDTLLYVYNSGWPAEGQGLPFVGPAGATGASGVPGVDGASGASGASGGTGGTGGTGGPGASGEPGPTGPTGATGASGGTGSTGGTGGTGAPGASGASGAGATRIFQTLTANTTLGASGDYVIYSNIATIPEVVLTAKTVARLALDGSNGSTTITDSSPNATTWVVAGNAALSTSVTKFGTASLSCPAPGDYIYTTSASSNFAFGTSDWTVEFWLRYSGNDNNEKEVFRFNSGTGFPSASIINNTFRYTGSGSVGLTSGSLSENTWYHIAICRSGTSTKVFVDGSQIGSTLSDSTNYTATTNYPRFGNTGPFTFALHLDDICINTSQAKYTSNFTAPTAALTDANVPSTTPAVTPQLTLPASNMNMYRVWNLNSESLSVKPASGQTIDGATGIALAQNDKKTILSDGATGWRTW